MRGYDNRTLYRRNILEPRHRMDQPQRRGIRALASMLPKVTAPIFKKRGFAEAGILTDWPAIVGEHLARHTMPEKIAFARGARSAGTLHVVTESAFAPELQHLEPQVLERINGYFGYFAVGKLRIQHGRVTHAKLDSVVRARLDQGRPAGAGRPATLSTGGTNGSPATPVAPAVRQATAGIDDDPLRAALERLGSAVHDRHNQSQKSAESGPLPMRGKD